MYLCPQDLLDSMYPFFMCKERMLITFLFTSHSKIVASAFYIPVCTALYIHTYTGAEQAVVVFRSHNGCAPERSRPSHNPFFVSLDAEP